MKVKIQTAVTPVMTVYDTEKPDEPGSEDNKFLKVIRGIFRPTVRIEDNDGYVMYKSGEFYTPHLMYLGSGLLILLLVNFAQNIHRKKRGK